MWPQSFELPMGHFQGEHSFSPRVVQHNYLMSFLSFQTCPFWRQSMWVLCLQGLSLKICWGQVSIRKKSFYLLSGSLCWQKTKTPSLKKGSKEEQERKKQSTNQAQHTHTHVTQGDSAPHVYSEKVATPGQKHCCGSRREAGRLNSTWWRKIRDLRGTLWVPQTSWHPGDPKDRKWGERWQGVSRERLLFAGAAGSDLFYSPPSPLDLGDYFSRNTVTHGD